MLADKINPHFQEKVGGLNFKIKDQIKVKFEYKESHGKGYLLDQRTMIVHCEALRGVKEEYTPLST